MKKNIYSHLTAKERNKLSFPANWLMKNNLLKGEILDFGCGYGTDVIFLNKMEFNILGYDNYYYNDYPTKKFDTILCLYVLNVLEPLQQSEVIMSVSELLKSNGKAYFAVRRDIRYEGFRLHKIHKKHTFQTNVVLNSKNIFKNDFCEIYEFEHFNTFQKTNNNCIFCNPKADIISETATFYAVYDKFPVNKGHALIIPKRHVGNYFDLTLHEQTAAHLLLNRIKQIVQKEYNPHGFNIGVNIGEYAGQTVDHVHIHLMPRYKGDVENPVGGVRNVIPGKGNYLNTMHNE